MKTRTVHTHIWNSSNAFVRSLKGKKYFSLFTEMSDKESIYLNIYFVKVLNEFQFYQNQKQNKKKSFK